MSYYRYHALICCNQRANGESCCNDHGASELLDYAKAKVKAAGVAGPGQVRVNKSGCLGRCDQGPVMVIYPEATWYTFVDKEDMDEIIEEHLLHGRVVERLKID